MDYIGSKEKLNQWIFEEIEAIVKPNNLTFLDACCGSGSVSRYAANKNYKVLACDNMSFPKHLIEGSIGNHNGLEHIDIINNLSGIEGFFFKEYSPTGKRMYFTEENAKKIDACRAYIENQTGAIKSYLIYCGIEALSRISNTAGTHGAFLKNFKTRAKDSFQLRPEKVINGIAKCYTSDILCFLQNTTDSYDILYIDPPYNSRQYPSNYHLYETFARYDSPPIKGMTGIRKDWQQEASSKFCQRKEARDFFRKIVEACTAPIIFISYSSDGLLSKEQFKELFENEMNLEFDFRSKEQRRYKADNNRTYKSDQLYEYLLIIKKDH